MGYGPLLATAHRVVSHGGGCAMTLTFVVSRTIGRFYLFDPTEGAIWGLFVPGAVARAGWRLTVVALEPRGELNWPERPD
jgi:hypothetical protein